MSKGTPLKKSFLAALDIDQHKTGCAMYTAQLDAAGKRNPEGERAVTLSQNQYGTLKTSVEMLLGEFALLLKMTSDRFEAIERGEHLGVRLSRHSPACSRLPIGRLRHAFRFDVGCVAASSSRHDARHIQPSSWQLAAKGDKPVKDATKLATRNRPASS